MDSKENEMQIVGEIGQVLVVVDEPKPTQMEFDFSDTTQAYVGSVTLKSTQE